MKLRHLILYCVDPKFYWLPHIIRSSFQLIYTLITSFFVRRKIVPLHILDQKKKTIGVCGNLQWLNATVVLYKE